MGEGREDPGKLRQFLASLIVNLSIFSYGMMIGWQSPMQPLLQSPDPPVGDSAMTDEEASWLSGSMCVAGTLVTPVVGSITERLGRKVTGCLNAIPLFASWLLLIFASNHAHLFASRVLSGVGGAFGLFVVPLYVSEISSDSVRGMLGSLLIFTLNTGILVAYILGAFLSFRNFAICSLIVPALYLGSFLYLPETPVYLVRRKRLHDAVKSLMWFRNGHNEVVEQEILRVQAQVKESAGASASVAFKDLFRDRGTIKALIISLGLCGGQQLCGIFAMVTYAETIFRLSGSSLSSEAAAMIIGAIQVFGSYLSTSLMERTGRRPLLLVSCLGMCISHYVLGSFCYLQRMEHDVTSFSWLPVAALSIFMVTYCLGMGPGPYVVMSEIFSRDISSLATMVGLFFLWFVAFLVVKFFASFVTILGIDGCFFLLGTFCAATFVFTFILLPETKGKPREIILDELNGVRRVYDDAEFARKETHTDKVLSTA